MCGSSIDGKCCQNVATTAQCFQKDDQRAQCRAECPHGWACSTQIAAAGSAPLETLPPSERVAPPMEEDEEDEEDEEEDTADSSSAADSIAAVSTAADGIAAAITATRPLAVTQMAANVAPPPAPANPSALGLAADGTPLKTSMQLPLWAILVFVVAIPALFLCVICRPAKSKQSEAHERVPIKDYIEETASELSIAPGFPGAKPQVLMSL